MGSHMCLCNIKPHTRSQTLNICIRHRIRAHVFIRGAYGTRPQVMALFVPSNAMAPKVRVCFCAPHAIASVMHMISSVLWLHRGSTYSAAI